MERLSYIDEHARSVDANRDRAWKALLKVVCKDPADPSTVPSGFVLDSAAPPTRLAMKGRHWFAEYALIFELDDEGGNRTRIRAESWGNFPGLHGKLYRALVIGSGGHRIVVRRMLRQIAAAA
ncbi:hypothetical protein DFR70_113165 [Nocardia tenerifensis]|uniref:Polyketide cyclase/dehydrase/lipid transport protein n=1 Tax=Nocardia tenerifensis TaxID=228006 RepID=A0A318JTU0_9NOCA|nr:hypothetical protein [Nocardia tenerifensis]PXX58830.1 hypothetical protein DFR70_113165 [Nocardia tenerifensis]